MYFKDKAVLKLMVSRKITSMLIKQQQAISNVLTFHVDSTFRKLGDFGGFFLEKWDSLLKGVVSCLYFQAVFLFNIVHAQTKYIAMTLSLCNQCHL